MTRPSRRHTVTVESGGTPRNYVSDGQRVTSVPLTIKRRNNRKQLIPPSGQSRDDQSGGFDEPMIRMLGKAFYWRRLIEQGRYASIAELSHALKMEQGWAAEVIRMTMLV